MFRSRAFVIFVLVGVTFNATAEALFRRAFHSGSVVAFPVQPEVEREAVQRAELSCAQEVAISLWRQAYGAKEIRSTLASSSENGRSASFRLTEETRTSVDPTLTANDFLFGVEVIGGDGTSLYLSPRGESILGRDTAPLEVTLRELPESGGEGRVTIRLRGPAWPSYVTGSAHRQEDLERVRRAAEPHATLRVLSIRTAGDAVGQVHLVTSEAGVAHPSGLSIDYTNVGECYANSLMFE